MKKNDNIKQLLEEIKYNSILIGNKNLEYLIDKYDNIEDLYNKLRKYNTTLETEEENINENIEYIYLNNYCIDYKNISRIELDKIYNNNKNSYDYIIKIVKKYVTPNEEDFIIRYRNEIDRNRDYDILRNKLKVCKKYIL